jgi:hypothetical protein
MLDAVGQGFAKRASTVQVVNRFMALPKWARVAAITAGLIIVVGAVSIPVAAVAVDERNRQLALEVAAKEGAEKKAAAEAAEALAEAKDAAAGYDAEFAGFTVSLAAAVHPDAAAAFEAARMKLAFAIADGGLEEVSAAVAAVTEALDRLVTSAEGQADVLIGASPLAGASRDALAQAIADLATDDDVTAALARVKAASDAVIAAQQAGLAAEVAAKQAAEAEAEANASNGSGSPGGDPSDGGVSIGVFRDPGIIGMFPGERGSCGEYPTGQVVTLEFGWEAREGNTVDIYYALTDGDYLATGGFMLLASGRGSSGSVSIPVTCPVGPGPTSLITVRAVAINENGSAASHYWGL